MSENKDAAFKLAVTRSEALFNYYRAERRAGVDSLTANQRTHEHAKHLDAENEMEQS
jgi:hypothetical protein